MANALTGEVPFTAGGATYKLVFDVNAFCLAEEALDGMTTDEMLDMLRRKRVGFRLVRAVIYAGLQANHPCHLIRAGEIISDAGLPASRSAVIAGFEAALAAAAGAQEGSEPGEEKGPEGSGTG